MIKLDNSKLTYSYYIYHAEPPKRKRWRRWRRTFALRLQTQMLSKSCHQHIYPRWSLEYQLSSSLVSQISSSLVGNRLKTVDLPFRTDVCHLRQATVLYPRHGRWKILDINRCVYFQSFLAIISKNKYKTKNASLFVSFMKRGNTDIDKL